MSGPVPATLSAFALPRAQGLRQMADLHPPSSTANTRTSLVVLQAALHLLRQRPLIVLPRDSEFAAARSWGRCAAMSPPPPTHWLS